LSNLSGVGKMTIRFLATILVGLLASACAGADYPGFFDAAVEVTTGVDLQDDLDYYLERQEQARQAALENPVEPQAVIRGPSPTANVTQTRARNGLVVSPHNTWSAIVVAGDFRAASGGETEAFDNARREVSRQLQAIGFDRRNITEFSMRPTRYPNNRLLETSFAGMKESLQRNRLRGDDGCLVYMTSHGFPTAFAIGAREVITPPQIHQMLDEVCGDDPTILVVSACYSGIFVQGEMTQPNRMIMTAARSDRTSFGCGEGTTYPYFDACFLESLEIATDWVDLARNTRGCVVAQEQAENLSPPSAPQIYLGPDARDIMMTPFARQQNDNYGPALPGT